MSDKPPKLIIPKDPVKIGTTPDGEPVWLELKDLIPTQEETEERWDKTLANREWAIVNKTAYLVLKNAALFIESTFWNTANKTGRDIYERGNAMAAFEWANQHGYEAIQDGLKTVVKVNGKVIREMDASMPERLGKFVAKRVNELVKKMPAPK